MGEQVRRSLGTCSTARTDESMVEITQAAVVEAHEMQDCGVQIGDVDRLPHLGEQARAALGPLGRILRANDFINFLKVS